MMLHVLWFRSWSFGRTRIFSKLKNVAKQTWQPAVAPLTDVADEHDFSVGRDVLGKTRLLVVPKQPLGLAGGLGFGCIGGNIEQVEPTFCTYGHHEVLRQRTR